MEIILAFFVSLLLGLGFLGLLRFIVKPRKSNVKETSTKPKPIIEPAPQSPKRNKQGRTPDEQELHEYMEDNPR